MTQFGPARVLLLVVLAAAAMWFGTGIGCSKARPPAAPVQVAYVTKVVQKDVLIYSEWVGTTEGFVNAQIHPKVQGYLLKQDYRDGSHVKAGQLLFEIDNRQYKAALDQALGDLANQEALLKRNQLDLTRYKALTDERVVARQVYDNALAAARSSRAQVDAARAAVENARLNVEWTQVKSPIDGIAGIAPVQVGDLVSTSTLLTTVSQLDPMKVNYPISEQEYLRLAGTIKGLEEGRTQEGPKLEMILADGRAHNYPGKLYVADREVDVQTGTIRVQGLFPNPDDVLRPGQYAKVRAVTETRRGALLVPQRAVSETQGQYQVAVVGPDSRAVLRKVTPGERVGTLWIIDDGLKPGERVMSEGVEKIKGGERVKVMPAPMPDLPTVPRSGGRAQASPKPAAPPSEG